jgi:dimethylargininase
METPRSTHAIVRNVPSSFHRAIRPAGSSEPIDTDLARQQHRLYCSALERLGLSLLAIASDDELPDCCYVEDAALVIGNKGIITAPGAAARRGETAAVEEMLGDHKEIHRIEGPATLDGGDVLRIDDRVYVGLSERTNEDAVEQLANLVAGDGYEVVAIEVRDILHLKSACTYLGGDVITWLPGHLEDPAFARYQKIAVPPREAHAANCLSVNGTVLIPTGAPETRARIEQAGFETVEIDISESSKTGGGLTCTSILF